MLCICPFWLLRSCLILITGGSSWMKYFVSLHVIMASCMTYGEWTHVNQEFSFTSEPIFTPVLTRHYSGRQHKPRTKSLILCWVATNSLSGVNSLSSLPTHNNPGWFLYVCLFSFLYWYFSIFPSELSALQVLVKAQSRAHIRPGNLSFSSLGAGTTIRRKGETLGWDYSSVAERLPSVG